MNKKKVSWWESKYSDYTHMTETEDSVVLHLKGGSLRNGLCFLDKFTQYADSRGKKLILNIGVCEKVVVPYQRWQELNDISRQEG